MNDPIGAKKQEERIDRICKAIDALFDLVDDGDGTYLISQVLDQLRTKKRECELDETLEESQDRRGIDGNLVA